MNTVVINLFAGPGTGKSSTAARLFSELKWRGVETELTGEFAKDIVWEESFKQLDNQVWLFANQHHRIHRLLNKVKFVITDSPLLLSIIYAKDYSATFNQFVLEEHLKLNNQNYFLQRTKKYSPVGRVQTEEEARQLDRTIWNALEKNRIDFTQIIATKDSAEQILADLEQKGLI